MEINSMEILGQAIQFGSFTGITGGFLVWFTSWCISKVITTFKTISS